MSLSDRRIILVRHGQTLWNKQYRFQGRTNIQLTEAGKKQVGDLAVRLSSWPPDVIFTSPLDRAVFTAGTIASQFNMSPVIIPELEEINFGSWEGKSFDYLRAEHYEQYSRWLEDPFFNPPQDAETWPQIEARLTVAANILMTCPQKRIIAVTHGGVIRAMWSVILGRDPHEAWFSDIPNCSMTGIAVREGRIYLSFANDNLHAAPGGTAMPVWRDEI